VSYAVVVPTRDRPSALERCLRAVSAAAPGAELIVVDDGSIDGAAVEAAAGRHGASVVRTPRVGAAAARNAGARRSRSHVVLFTDDDCLPGPAWGETLAAAVAAAPALAIVGGRTVPCAGSRYVAASQSVVRTVEDATRFRATSNVGCRRQTVVDLPFDETFVEASAEDRDWCARVVAAGGSVADEPRAVVRHCAAPGPRAFWRRHARYGRGARRLRSDGPAGSRSGLALRVVRDGFRRGPVVGALVVVAQVATLVGYATARGVSAAR
jgi:glycosyltransferase involved in cell wall biosynthesis